jgi:thymidine kinase
MRESETGFIFIIGNMFGSKTSEMIHLLNLEQNMGRKVQAFKISWDDRYRAESLLSHQGTAFPARQVKDTSGIVELLKRDTEVLGIEEVQFFDERIIDFILENKERYLIVATALQLDFRGNPFPLRSTKGREFDSDRHVGHLLPYAKILSKYPQCTFDENGRICREEAIYIQRFRFDGRLAPYSDATIVVGGKDKYSPRCIEHFVKPKK